MQEFRATTVMDLIDFSSCQMAGGLSPAFGSLEAAAATGPDAASVGRDAAGTGVGTAVQAPDVGASTSATLGDVELVTDAAPFLISGASACYRLQRGNIGHACVSKVDKRSSRRAHHCSQCICRRHNELGSLPNQKSGMAAMCV